MKKQEESAGKSFVKEASKGCGTVVGAAVGTVVVGAAVGFVLGGPGGAVIGAKVAGAKVVDILSNA